MKFLPLLVFLPLFAIAQNPYQALTTTVGISGSIEGLAENNLKDFGTGVSAVDFTGDGLDDIVLATGENLPMRFFQNNGDGTFQEIDNFILNSIRFQKMVLFGDIDNDGDPDLFVTSWDKSERLYRNDGNLVFKDITNAAGIKQNFEETDGASFGDVNNDGLLDLYVCNRTKENVGNYLYINQGNNTFSEEAVARGVSDDTQLSFQSIFFDYDNDGDQDLYVVNDRDYANALFQNDGTGYFTDVSITSGTNIRIDAMNAGVGDMDNDGFQEIFVTNTPNGGGGGTRLLYNNGDGTFSDISSEAGAHIPLYTWAGLWLDFDNDTDQDLFVATLRDTDPFLWLKNFSVELGLDVFLNPWPAGLPGGNQAAFSAAYFDYNNDGLLDIVTPNGAPSPIQVWENITVNNNNWVMFDLEGVYSTRDAVGARVEVFLGEQRYIRYLTLGDCYLTQNHKKLHFGLGAATNIDSVVIRWLSGITETYENVGVNQIHSFVEGNSFELSANMETLDPSCFGAEDGSVSVSPVGGTGPFAFSWNNGETLPTLAGLSAGRYIVTLTDANGQQGIAFTDLVDPAPVVVAINATNDSGLGDGMVSAVVSGGSGTYDYQWSNGSDLAEITNLTDGIYTLNVLDELGCGTSGYGVVYNEMGPCAAYIPTDIEIGLTGAVFYWSEVPNRENYRFAYRESGTLPWFTTDGIINDPYVAIDKLDPGFTYDYKTKTNCIGGEKSDWSDVYSFTTNIDGPDLCQAWEVSSVYVDNNSAFLFFDDQPDATAYRLRYRALGAPNWLKVTTTYSLITLDPLASGTTFEYQTATRCTLGWTEWSGSEIFETEGSLLSPELVGVANTPELIVVADMLLFPNPTQDILNVAVRNGQPRKMIIQDASGREQLIQNLSSSGIHVNLSGMESGIYFMTIILEDGQILNERFIKQ